MSDFEITVNGNNYTGKLHVYGYSYKIVMLLHDIPVSFEADEERNLRAVIPEGSNHQIDKQLLQAVAEELERNIRG